MDNNTQEENDKVMSEEERQKVFNNLISSLDPNNQSISINKDENGNIKSITVTNLNADKILKERIMKTRKKDNLTFKQPS